VTVIGDGDAGTLLAAVLEGVEREEGQPGDIASGGDDPDDTALVVGGVVLPQFPNAIASVSVPS
jgi:hypothetical protein